MAIDKEKSEMQRQSAAEFKIQKYATKLKGQWSQKEGKQCLHSDWDSLARAVGLGSAEIPYLKVWVAQNKLNPPTRLKPKTKKTSL